MSNMLDWITSKAKGVTRHHLEGIGAASAVIFTCFYIAHVCKTRFWRKRSGNYHRSQSFGALHGGKVAMQRIFDAQHARVDPSVLVDAEKKLKELLAKDQLHFSHLQSAIAKLEMSGKEDTAVKLLSEALQKAEKECRYHDAYELDMLLVEMFIYKGEYDKALNRKCLKVQDISDARRPLYMTVIYIIQGKNRLAEESWKEYQKIRNHCRWPEAFEDGTNTEAFNFPKFVNTVKFLKKEIEDAHKTS